MANYLTKQLEQFLESNTKTAIYTFLFCLTLFAVFMAGFLALISEANYRTIAKKIVEKDFETIISKQGHFVGIFGQCPYKQDSHYYVPCISLLNEQQKADFLNFSIGRK